MSEIELIERDSALNIANGIKETIAEYCDDFIIVGGLRREIAQVNMVNIVCRISDHFTVTTILGNTYPKLSSRKEKYTFWAENIPIEIFIAVTERQYEVLKLVKTGSAGFIRDLCTRANEKSMALRYSYKDGLCGLYGAIKSWDKESERFKMFVNPMRKVAYKEDEIITTVTEDEKYLNPLNRNLGWEEMIDEL